MRLSASGLSVELAGRRVLHDIAVDVSPGEVVGLVGPNGAGKSTLLRALAGILPAQGRVTIGDRNLASLDHTERTRRIAHLPQARVVTWEVPVSDLVALGRHPWRDAGSPRAVRQVERAMHLMDVSHLADRPATELSGGELARVLAARAIAQETPLLLADEPASGLDPAHQIRMMQALRQLSADGCGVLVSLHDLGLAARWCHRIVVLAEGAVVAAGAAASVLDDVILADVFGISAFRAADAQGPLLLPSGLVPKVAP